MSPQTTEPKPSQAMPTQAQPTQAKSSPAKPTQAQPTQAQPTHPASSNTARTKDVMSILVTGLPIIGAIGTCFCWTAANFYVGDVEVQTSRPYDSITVKVFDNKGSEATFHTPKFQLMPGNYHLVINADNLGAQHADTNVAFHAKTKVQVELPSDLDRKEAQEEPKAKGKHFWQFWKKN
ncbi:MAG: hypothetical protein K2Y39_00735 [Candidatus Obscuribacterales bacterium]|nr:hypothetical protein [Candidatus Obscuribacterales bacterium]